MNSLYNMVFGKKGLMRRAFRLFGMKATLQYVEDIEYPPITGSQKQVVQSVSISFIPDPTKRSNEVNSNGLLLQQETLAGLVSCHELERLPVAHQDLLVLGGITRKIVKVEQESFEGFGTILRLETLL